MGKADVHYLQSTIWAEVKSAYGWKTEKLACDKVEAGYIEVYIRSVGGLGKLIYIPCLASVDLRNAKAITDLLRRTYKGKGFAVRLELNQLREDALVNSLGSLGWKQTKSHVQYRNTINIDLTRPEDDIWMGFKSRGRYEILQAQKASVTVVNAEPTDDNLEKMYKLMQVTSERNKFYIRNKKFTMDYWQKFRDNDQLRLFFATHDQDLLAGSVILTSGKLAWNKDGGSLRTKSNLMAPRLIQWEVMKSLKAEGIKNYDLGGLPAPEDRQTSAIPGIYIFKSAFAKEIVTLMPTVELPLSKRYALWPKAEKQWLRVYNLFAHNLWY